MISRITFIGGGLQGGGQERSLVNLSNHLTRIGYSVSIINLFRTDNFYYLDERITIEWPIISREKYHRLIYAFIVLKYVRQKIRTLKPDVILSFGEWFNPFVILSTRFLNIPVYISDRMGPTMKLDPLVQLTRRLLYRYADGVIVQTQFAREIVQKLTKITRIKVIPNPLYPINANTNYKVKRIVSLGRLSKEKGHIHLIRAFSKIQSPEWTLAIIGDGYERTYLQREAEDLHIAGRVKFYGQLKEFAAILGESEIFVLPSLHEGFPNALLEAMSIPLACISTNCYAGPEDIIQHGVNGLLVKPGDEIELKAAIDLLIENPELRKNLAGEAYNVRELYKFERIAEDYIKFIES